MVSIWSTDAVREKDGFAYWYEVVREAVLNVATEAQSDHFRARISWQAFGELRFTSFKATRHELVRNRAHTARAPADDYLVSLQCAGRSQFTQADDAFEVVPGEIAIIDGQQPFRIVFPESVKRVIAVVPRNTLDARAPWLRKFPRRKLPVDAPFGDLIRRHLLELTDEGRNLSRGEAHLLSDNLCNLLALATGSDTPANTTVARLQLESLLAYCRQNLDDPTMSPSVVASRFGISVRTLHLRFRDVGQTFGRWLIENRLEACSKALIDAHQRGCNVSEIAYRWGFNDISHFNRAFRARYGMTPRQWRHASGE